MERLGYVIVSILTLLVVMPVSAGTVLHYDFEDGVAGAVMNDFPVTQVNGTVGTVDLSGNGYDMYSWDDYWGPMFSAEGDTPTGMGLSLVHDGHRDGYTLADGIRAWSPSTWTIELSFKFNDPTVGEPLSAETTGRKSPTTLQQGCIFRAMARTMPCG